MAATQRSLTTIQHLVFGETIHYVVPDAAFGGSIYSALAELALKTNATLSIHQGIIRVEDRSVITAVAEGATGTGSGNLSFEDASRTFPSRRLSADRKGDTSNIRVLAVRRSQGSRAAILAL